MGKKFRFLYIIFLFFFLIFNIVAGFYEKSFLNLLMAGLFFNLILEEITKI